MNCQGNVNSTLPTQLPHKFSYIVAILGHNYFESPNMYFFLVKKLINHQNNFEKRRAIFFFFTGIFLMKHY
jgi:hypothetical protein